MSAKFRRFVLLFTSALVAGAACSNAEERKQQKTGRRQPQGQPTSHVERLGSTNDTLPNLSRRCEAASVANEPRPVQPVELGLQLTLRIGDDAPEKLGRVVGVEGSRGAGSIRVADAFRPGILVFAEDGSFLTSFGDEGEGPGDFQGMGVGSHGGRAVFDQLEQLGDSLLTVAGHDHVHLFATDGAFVDRVETMFSLSGPLAHRHLAAWSDEEVLFVRTGAGRFGSGDPDSIPPQHIEKLVGLRREGDSTTTAVRALHNNPIVRLGSFEGFPPNSYFQKHYTRTWDAGGGRLLAIYSYHRHRVCLFGDGFRLIGAYQVDAPVVEVDDDIREAALERSKRALGDSPPMIGGSWEDFYDVWPETLPRYTDIAVASDSTVWAERPTGLDQWAIDLFRAGQGYLGTLRSLSGRLPLDFAGGCPVWTTTDLRDGDPQASFYGLEVRCPG